MYNTKKSYEAPTLEVFEAKVERGFAGSGEWHPTSGPLEPLVPNEGDEPMFS